MTEIMERITLTHKQSGNIEIENAHHLIELPIVAGPHTFLFRAASGKKGPFYIAV